MSCDEPGGAPTGDWTTSACPNNTTGKLVSVRVTLTFSAITPIIGQFDPADVACRRRLDDHQLGVCHVARSR